MSDLLRLSQAPILKRIQADQMLQGMNGAHWIKEIGQSLSLLFNTHLGSAACREDFGLPEFHPEEMKGVIRFQQKAGEIAKLIESFEPRLQRVKVEVQSQEENKDRMVFKVFAILDAALSSEKVSYYTVMTSHGRVWLKQ